MIMLMVNLLSHFVLPVKQLYFSRILAVSNAIAARVTRERGRYASTASANSSSQAPVSNRAPRATPSLPETKVAAERRRINAERSAIAKEKAQLVLETQYEVVSDTELSDKCWPPTVPWVDTEVPPTDRQTFVSFRPDTPEVLSTMLPLVKQEPVQVPDEPASPTDVPTSPSAAVDNPPDSSMTGAPPTHSSDSRPPEVKQEASFDYSPVPMKGEPDTKRIKRFKLFRCNSIK